jgi:hypothetical protein
MNINCIHQFTQLAWATSVVLHTIQQQIHFGLACNSPALLTVMLPQSKYSVQQKEEVRECMHTATILAWLPVDGWMVSATSQLSGTDDFCMGRVIRTCLAVRWHYHGGLSQAFSWLTGESPDNTSNLVTMVTNKAWGLPTVISVCRNAYGS